MNNLNSLLFGAHLLIHLVRLDIENKIGQTKVNFALKEFESTK